MIDLPVLLVFFGETYFSTQSAFFVEEINSLKLTCFFLNNVMHSTLHSALNTQICIHIQKEGYAHHRKYETEIYSLGLALLVTKGITL